MKEKIPATQKRKKIKVFILLLISLIFVTVAVSFAIIGISYFENRNFSETFYSVSSLKVNNNIRIIQISDLHNCTYGDKNEKLIDRVGKLNPDIILLTGDCVDSNENSEENIVSLCASFVEIAPTYYIYGNNEVETVVCSCILKAVCEAEASLTEELGSFDFLHLVDASNTCCEGDSTHPVAAGIAEGTDGALK
jgi:predicted MPP superfamily phosphohydrolase